MAEGHLLGGASQTPVPATVSRTLLPPSAVVTTGHCKLHPKRHHAMLPSPHGDQTPLQASVPTCSRSEHWPQRGAMRSRWCPHGPLWSLPLPLHHPLKLPAPQGGTDDTGEGTAAQPAPAHTCSPCPSGHPVPSQQRPHTGTARPRPGWSKRAASPHNLVQC